MTAATGYSYLYFAGPNALCPSRGARWSPPWLGASGAREAAGARVALAFAVDAATGPMGAARTVVVAARRVLSALGIPGAAGRALDASTVFLGAPSEPVALALCDALDRGARGELGPRGRRAAALDAVASAWTAPTEVALLAEAAARRGVQFRVLDEGALALGTGRRRRLYVDYFFDGDPWRSIADDKLTAARALERAGLPTASPRAAATPAEAARLAAEAGFPAVLKPSRAWAQVGVRTGLRDASAVAAAFDRAVLHAGPLAGPMVVEAQRPGRHVRATLVRGRLVAALAGEAPTVTGDGRATLDALTRRRHGLAEGDAWDARSRGVFEAVFAAQGLSGGAVPARGRRVRVGFEAHGATRDVTASLHPTTRAALDRVGRLFAGALLGVDLLLRAPDAPFDPARDTVLEVNTGAGFAMHDPTSDGGRRDVAGALLRGLFPGGARGATVPAMACAEGGGARLDALAGALARAGLHPAGYTQGRAWTATPEGVLGEGPRAAALAALDPRADVLLFEVDDALAHAEGLPVDRVDLAVVPRSEGECAKLLRAIARETVARWPARRALVRRLTSD